MEKQMATLKQMYCWMHWGLAKCNFSRISEWLDKDWWRKGCCILDKDSDIYLFITKSWPAVAKQIYSVTNKIINHTHSIILFNSLYKNMVS